MLRQEGHGQYALNHFVSYKILSECNMSFLCGSMISKRRSASQRGSAGCLGACWKGRCREQGCSRSSAGLRPTVGPCLSLPSTQSSSAIHIDRSQQILLEAQTVLKSVALFPFHFLHLTGIFYTDKLKN